MGEIIKDTVSFAIIMVINRTWTIGFSATTSWDIFTCRILSSVISSHCWSFYLLDETGQISDRLKIPFKRQCSAGYSSSKPTWAEKRRRVSEWVKIKILEVIDVQKSRTRFFFLPQLFVDVRAVTASEEDCIPRRVKKKARKREREKGGSLRAFMMGNRYDISSVLSSTASKVRTTKLQSLYPLTHHPLCTLQHPRKSFKRSSL